MLPEITGPDLPVPESFVQKKDIQCEGNKVATRPTRRLPLELLIAIADQVSFLLLLGMEPYWTEIF